MFTGLASHIQAEPGRKPTDQEREAARFRQRRLIFNNDGCDIFHPRTPIISTKAEFLARRTTPLLGSHVDMIAYCTTAGTFGSFWHRTKVAQMAVQKRGALEFNRFEEFLKQGTDPLQMTIEFCRENSKEVLWSLRMNDTHDADKNYGPDFIADFKKENPRYLLSTTDRRPARGQWSAMDYGRSEVRDFVYACIAEVIGNYDVDGVQLDFWRHPIFFKRSSEGRPLEQTDLDAMTSLVRRVRAKLDEEGTKRGRYLLLSIRTPDSLEYSRAIGLDVERWMSEGLVDLYMPGSGYFQITSWKESVMLGRRYGVPVYASLSDARNANKDVTRERNAIESLRARALDAWSAGVDGIEMFNFFQPRHPLWRELGSAEVLRPLSKRYYVRVVGARNYLDGRSWGTSPRPYLKIGTLMPDNPETLKTGETRAYELHVGDDLSASPALEARLHIRTNPESKSKAPSVRWNGLDLELEEGGAGVFEAKVESAAVTPATHVVEVTATGPIELTDIVLSLAPASP
ncbi:hypothetical protein OPIT5_23810 [Opitutaceae bacterium TAV5]|nr:hypothetical protein OPIT5_23810 [Opitutaceae bacterium TAV5]